MEVISGFEGNVKKFIERFREIWEKEGSKERGGKKRYKIRIGLVNGRAIFAPAVSTKTGTEYIVAWNLSQNDITKIEEEAKKIGLPFSSADYLWWDRLPPTLPNESQKPNAP
jgi:hypothetical protein